MSLDPFASNSRLSLVSIRTGIRDTGPSATNTEPEPESEQEQPEIEMEMELK